MKLKIIILIVLVLCIVNFSIAKECQLWSSCEDSSEDSDDLILTPTPTTPTPTKPTPTPTSTPTKPTPTNSEVIGGGSITNTPTSGGGYTPNTDDSDDSDGNTSDSPSGTTQPIIKQNEKDPYYSKSISGSYITYAVGVACIAFIMVILYKKFRARDVAPIDIDTANYSVLEMRD